MDDLVTWLQRRTPAELDLIRAALALLATLLLSRAMAAAAAALAQAWQLDALTTARELPAPDPDDDAADGAQLEGWRPSRWLPTLAALSCWALMIAYLMRLNGIADLYRTTDALLRWAWGLTVVAIGGAAAIAFLARALVRLLSAPGVAERVDQLAPTVDAVAARAGLARSRPPGTPLSETACELTRDAVAPLVAVLLTISLADSLGFEALGVFLTWLLTWAQQLIGIALTLGIGLIGVRWIRREAEHDGPGTEAAQGMVAGCCALAIALLSGAVSNPFGLLLIGALLLVGWHLRDRITSLISGLIIDGCDRELALDDGPATIKRTMLFESELERPDGERFYRSNRLLYDAVSRASSEGRGE